jgi:putative ribosome biogenesis GTPase RsgA
MSSFYSKRTSKIADKDIMDDRNDGIILVMGVTGAGKSYFINQLKSESAVEGHSLYSGTYHPSFCL